MATPVFDKSIFKKYFDSDDANAIAWANNVLDKLKAKGGVAEFILREDKDGNPTNFDDLFLPTAIFFSYLVQLARQFENFTDDDFLSDQYLLQHGQFTGGESLIQLVYAISNSLRIRAQRGTNNMVAISNDVGVPNGELLRLINWGVQEFFKLGTARPQFNGWNLSNSSPGHRGCTGRYDLNIGYEYTEDVEDLSKYPLIHGEDVSLTTFEGKNCIEITNVLFGDVAGIGLDDSTKRIVVDPRFDFEITFYVAQDIIDNNITFGCLAFDSVGDPVKLEKITDSSKTNFFFEGRALNQFNKFYFIRGILFNKDKANVTAEDAKLNIGFGQNLRMPQNVVSIIPYIVLDDNLSADSQSLGDSFIEPTLDGDTLDGDTLDADFGFEDSGSSAYDGIPSIFLWNIKITPCALKYERCYLNNKNFVDLIFQNKNGKWSNVQIDSILRKYFIPYNTAFKTTNLDDLGEVTPETSLLLLEDGNYILLEDSNRIQLE